MLFHSIHNGGFKEGARRENKRATGRWQTAAGICEKALEMCVVDVGGKEKRAHRGRIALVEGYLMGRREIREILNQTVPTKVYNLEIFRKVYVANKISRI